MATCESDDGPFTIAECDCPCGIDPGNPTPRCPTEETPVYNSPVLVNLGSFSRLRSCLMPDDIPGQATACSYVFNGIHRLGINYNPDDCTFYMPSLCGSSRVGCGEFAGAYILPEDTDLSPNVQQTVWGGQGNILVYEDPPKPGVFYLGNQMAVFMVYYTSNRDIGWLQESNHQPATPKLTVTTTRPIALYGGDHNPPIGCADALDLDVWLDLCDDLKDNGLPLFSPEDPLTQTVMFFTETAHYGASGLEDSTPESGKTITLNRLALGLPPELQAASEANNPEVLFCIFGRFGGCFQCKFNDAIRPSLMIPVCQAPSTATVTFL